MDTHEKIEEIQSQSLDGVDFWTHLPEAHLPLYSSVQWASRVPTLKPAQIGIYFRHRQWTDLELMHSCDLRARLPIWHNPEGIIHTEVTVKNSPWSREEPGLCSRVWRMWWVCLKTSLPIPYHSARATTPRYSPLVYSIAPFSSISSYDPAISKTPTAPFLIPTSSNSRPLLPSILISCFLWPLGIPKKKE